MSEHTKDTYTEAWFAEQPTLREKFLGLETLRKEAETRILKELDSVCALASPRVAFEMRLDYLAQTSTWNVVEGMMGVDDKDDEDDEEEEKAMGVDDKDDEDDEEEEKASFDYEILSGSGIDLSPDDNSFLMKDHGNEVSFGWLDQQDKDVFIQKIYLSVKSKKDFDSMTVAS
jgi:hypothetical protein